MCVVFLSGFFDLMFSRFTHVVCQYFIFLLSNNTPLYGYTTFYLSIYQLMDIRVMPTFCGNVAMYNRVQVFV